MNAIELIPAKRIVPVVVINDAAHAVPPGIARPHGAQKTVNRSSMA